MVTQSNPEQLELNIDPVCKTEGCMQQTHFKTIRKMQEMIFELQEKLRGYEQE